MTREAEIAAALQSCFSSSELHRLVKYDTDLSKLADRVAWSGAIAFVVSELVEAARRSGLLPALLSAVIRERPARRQELIALRNGLDGAAPDAIAPPVRNNRTTVYKTTPGVLSAINEMLDGFEPVGQKSVYWLLGAVSGRIVGLLGLEMSLRSEYDEAYQRDPLRYLPLTEVMAGRGDRPEIRRNILFAADAAKFVGGFPSEGNPDQWAVLRAAGLGSTETRYARQPLSMITADHVVGLNALESELDRVCQILENESVVSALCVKQQNGAAERDRLMTALERLKSARGDVRRVKRLLLEETPAEADPFAAWG